MRKMNAALVVAARRQTSRRALATLPLRLGEVRVLSTSLMPAWEGLLDAVARVNSGGHTLSKVLSVSTWRQNMQ